jgi:hypothetical protein
MNPLETALYELRFSNMTAAISSYIGKQKKALIYP